MLAGAGTALGGDPALSCLVNHEAGLPAGFAPADERAAGLERATRWNFGLATSLKALMLLVFFGSTREWIDADTEAVWYSFTALVLAMMGSGVAGVLRG